MRQLFQNMFRVMHSENSEKNYFQENAHIFLGSDQVMRKTLRGCVILGGYGRQSFCFCQNDVRLFSNVS